MSDKFKDDEDLVKLFGCGVICFGFFWILVLIGILYVALHFLLKAW